MHKEGISKYLALRKATELAMGNHTTPETSLQTRNTMTPNPPQDLTKVFKTLRQKYYRGTLAQEYAKERNLDYKKLELGFNPYSNTNLKSLKNCLVFPLKDINDKVVSLYGRSVAKNPRSKHFYLKNRSGLYPGYPRTDTKTLIIVEAPIDAATLISNLTGTYSILSLYGTNGWTEEHTTAIKRIENLEEVIFFMDGDPAGKQAIKTYSGLVKALASEVSISRVETPESEDVNSLLDSHSSEILQHLIESRSPLNQESKPQTKEAIFSFSPEESSEEKKNKPEKLETIETESISSEIPPLYLEDPEFIGWNYGLLEIIVIGGVPMYPVDKMLLTLEIKKKNSDRPRHKIRQQINLYDDDKVERISNKIADRMDLGSSEVQDSLLILADLLTEYRKEVNHSKTKKEVEPRQLTPDRTKKVIEFLEKPGLMKRTGSCIGKTGMVGEEINRLILWLVYTSRLREHPLHIICLGASGTGKTHLQEKIAALIPESEKQEITAMSDNSVYYFGENELKHKLVLIEDLDGANEEKVLYALRELMSKKKISKAIVIKDNKGNMKTITMNVNGPICLGGTTTREGLYEDNANRSLLIYLDQGRKQRERIMDYQRKVSANLIDKYAEGEMVEFLKDVQTVLKPVRVVNPYAIDLAIPEEVFKPLRTNSHYLQFIETVTFYHQRQREVKTDARNRRYIETAIEDIEIANGLLKEVLLSKSDELSKASRRFYETIKSYLSQYKKESFFSGELRKAYRMSPATVNRHLYNLKRYGYIKVFSGSKTRGYEYELIKDEKDLKVSIETALDEVLNRIKAKQNGTKKQELVAQ
ncbi:toprim domain-containing protein [Portibacter lacus]|uniref:Toprim domain-containing protein n=1 Tax=Portibacter lacus TaxID=1099794 RepID=A0AA37SZD1_9BACT|nr:toprim domain-containing protein [Portibacter lacus]GLR20210.1 hypothetical protein GCM10007940_48260 [Portibacter lacus]